MKKIISILSLLLAAAIATFAQQLEYITAIKEKIESTFSLLEKDGFLSGEIIVSLNNKLVVHNYYGKSNYESNLGFADNSLFEIASVIKPFTVLINAMRVNEGKFITLINNKIYP